MIVLVGVGNIGKVLLSKLSREFEITCIDSGPEARTAVEGLRGTEKARLITGDATSRLVLEKAGIDESEAVLITTTDEKINREVVRILHDHFTPRRIIAIGTTQKGGEEMQSLGAEVINLFTASANDLRNLIEHQAKTAHGIGIGKNEILEVEVHPSSRLKNRPLGSIAPIRWNMGIIYRDGNIIVPKPETVLKEKDRVVVLGDPNVLKTVAELLTADFQKFPLEFGTALMVYLFGAEKEDFFQEIQYLYSTFQLQRLLIIYSASAEKLIGGHDAAMEKLGLTSAVKVVSALHPAEAVRNAIEDQSVQAGLVALSKSNLEHGRISLFSQKKKLFVHAMLEASKCPLFLCRGTFPYEKLVVPALENSSLQHQLSKAIELSHTISNELYAALVKPSQYLATADEITKFEEAKKIISNTGLVHRKKIELRLYEGNPVKEIVNGLAGFHLLVLGPSGWKPGWKNINALQSFLFPDVAWRIMRDAPVSCLVLPGLEESL